jgi:hypothetical protein
MLSEAQLFCDLFELWKVIYLNQILISDFWQLFPLQDHKEQAELQTAISACIFGC